MYNTNQISSFSGDFFAYVDDVLKSKYIYKQINKYVMSYLNWL